MCSIIVYRSCGTQEKPKLWRKCSDMKSVKARAILEFITDSVKEQGYPPTIREIGMRFGINSTNGVRYYLSLLEKNGYVKRRSKVSRGIELTSLKKQRSNLIDIPLIGRVAAGSPILAAENIEEVLSLDSSLLTKGALFALRVQGDSMVGAGIEDGDLVLVRQQKRAESGEIVVAVLGEEATVKRLMVRGKRTYLKPENDAYREICVDVEPACYIAGKVVGLIRKL
jgi:repressor LexA